MLLKKVNIISDDVYGDIKSFKNYSIYHSKQWHDFLNKTFDWNINFVLGICSDKVCFILPYIEKKRYNLKKYSISLPFSHKINIAYKIEYEDNLVEFENKISDSFSNFEIHDECKTDIFRKVTLNNITKINLIKYGNLDELYKSFDYNSIKYKINKFHKFNLEVKEDITDEAASDFHYLELLTRKRLGSPMYPECFFKQLLSIVDCNDIFLKIVYKESIPLAGIIILKDNESALYAYSAYSDEMKSNKIYATEYLIWEGLKWAWNKGLKNFDFGTTPNHLTGLRQFKEKWGGETTELNYSLYNIQSNFKRNSESAKMVSFILSHLPTRLFMIFSNLIIKLFM